MSGLTRRQRAALAELTAGPFTRIRAGWRSPAGGRFDCITIGTLAQRGMADLDAETTVATITAAGREALRA